MDKLTDTNGAEAGTTPADFGRVLLERLRRDPVPRLRIPTDDPQEDRLVLDSESCRFDVEWHLYPDRTSHVDIFVEHRSDPALLAGWLARNLDRVNEAWRTDRVAGIVDCPKCGKHWNNPHYSTRRSDNAASPDSP